MPRAPRITNDAITQHAAHAAAANAARGPSPSPVLPPALVGFAIDALAAWQQAEQLLHLMRHTQHALRRRNDSLRAQIDRLERLAKVGRYAPAGRPPRVIPADEQARMAAMALARATAMASGQTTRAAPAGD